MKILSKKCLTCGNVFHNHSCQTSGSRTWITKKYCSIKCCNYVKRKHKVRIVCFFCGKIFYVHRSIANANKKYCSNACKYNQFKIDSIGEKNHQWKGSNVGYTSLHIWVYRTLGQPNYCEICGTTKNRKYQWANKSGKYLRKKSDWIRLCVPCHSKYDKKLNLFISKPTRARRQLLKLRLLRPSHK